MKRILLFETSFRNLDALQDGHYFYFGLKGDYIMHLSICVVAILQLISSHVQILINPIRLIDQPSPHLLFFGRLCTYRWSR